MQRPGQDPVAKDDVPWWMKYAGRGLGTVGSISKPMHSYTISFAISFVHCALFRYLSRARMRTCVCTCTHIEYHIYFII